jgi:glycosyltransferase involved in cell wall biosynthesis
VNRLADLTIFQSEYARRATRERFRVIEQDGPVIHNPVDVHAFSQEGGRLPLPEGRRVVSVSWSLNPKKGAAAVYATAARNPDVGFYLCGRYEHVPALPNLHQLGVINHDQLPAVLRSCHALLTYSENEACPNHVLEALATGLPVLYRDSGAMSEVIGACGVAVEPDTCGAALEDVMRDWTDWSRRARARAMTCFLPDQVFSRYVAEMTAACERPPRTGRAWRQVRAWTGVFS